MKKIVIFALIFAMMAAVIGCAPKAEQPDANASEETVQETGAGLEAAANKYFAEFPGSRIITWEDLFAKIDAGDEPFILSIRQADVYGEGHIQGAYLAAWGEDLANKVGMLPKDQTVYVYCYSGQTAGQAVALMNLLGIDAVSVKSGYNYGAMKTEGYEAYVETTPNELPDAGAEFDAEILEFVKQYFMSVEENANFQIDSADVETLVEAGEAIVIDIRAAEDYAAGHIDEAINIPFGANMQESFTELPKDQKLIVACYSGQTAGQTVAILRALGYDAISLKFGMGTNGWTKYVKTSAANKYFSEYPGARMISWEDLFTKMDAGEEAFILSIRSAEDYATGHIKGAYLAAWGTDLAEKVGMLPTDKPVYVYCYTGQTAGQAVALMNMLGIEAYSVTSGFNKGAMVVEGYEAYVETDANELPDAGASFNPFLLSEVQAYFNGIEENASYKIGLEEALAAVEAGEVTVVDIRKAEDFAAGHIEGAINIPFGENMQEKFAELPAGKLVVACYSGQTAGQTTAVMRMLGYDAVSMHLGMKLGWIAEGYPVVTE